MTKLKKILIADDRLFNIVVLEQLCKDLGYDSVKARNGREAMELARKVFLSYLEEVNRLKEQPQWYNALTDNCTTSILKHTMPYNPEARLDWRLIVNGYVDEMLYERKTIDTRLPFAELKKRSYINPRAQAADQNPAFSQLIRMGLPGKEIEK